MTDSADNGGRKSGPDRKTLQSLFYLLPQLNKGLKDGSLTGKGKVSKPRKMCKVCSRLWDYVRVPVDNNPMVEGDFCAECDEKLKSGMVAFTFENKYAFAESQGSLADFRGTLVHIQAEHVWREIERAFNQSQPSPPKDAQDRN